MHAIEGRFGPRRWVFIPDTLHLGTLFVSEDLANEITAHPRCRIEGPARELGFTAGRHDLDFS